MLSTAKVDGSCRNFRSSSDMNGQRREGTLLLRLIHQLVNSSAYPTKTEHKYRRQCRDKTLIPQYQSPILSITLSINCFFIPFHTSCFHNLIVSLIIAINTGLLNTSPNHTHTQTSFIHHHTPCTSQHKPPKHTPTPCASTNKTSLPIATASSGDASDSIVPRSIEPARHAA